MATDLQIAVRKVVSINPATGETLRSFDSVGDEDVRGAVSRARAAQQGWNALGLRKRLAIVRNFQQLLHEKKSEVAQVVTREAGKPYVEALLTEVAVVLDTAGFLLDNAYRLLRPEGEIGILEFSEPRGLLGKGYRIYFRHVLPRIGTLISGVSGAYSYLPASVARFPEPPEMLERMKAAGFRQVSWTPYSFGIAGLFRGKK